MVRDAMELAAILIAPNGAGGALRGLMDRLAGAGVVVTIVDELATAIEVASTHATPPAMLLDLRDLSAGEHEDARKATEAIRRLLAVAPNTLPIAVTHEADAALVLACMRGGAGDVIDLHLEGSATAKTVVTRVCQRQAERVREVDAAHDTRGMVEELLKDLIRTERRSIDAEEALAARARRTGEMQAVTGADIRSPSVLLVEHARSVADELADRLETAGVATFAYVTGEEALRDVELLASTAGIDLALVAAQLPGIDGLETVRRLRSKIPGLPAFLVTSVQDANLAVAAADLGVVGFVQKPLHDVETLVVRLAQLARDALMQTRERVYLQRIKERHERVLARYRSLPREP